MVKERIDEIVAPTSAPAAAGDLAHTGTGEVEFKAASRDARPLLGLPERKKRRCRLLGLPEPRKRRCRE